MARKPKFIPGPSRLSKILASFRQAPRPHLNNVRSLKLTMALRNDHFGARHFVRDSLPSIQYTNPTLEISVTKKPKSKEDTWKPELELELRDGTTRTLDLEGKWSSTIFQELMDIGGGSGWEKWKRERIAAGLPIVDVPEAKKVQTQKAAPKAPQQKPPQEKTKDEKNVPEQLVWDPTKTGAAAILP